MSQCAVVIAVMFLPFCLHGFMSHCARLIDCSSVFLAGYF